MPVGILDRLAHGVLAEHVDPLLMPRIVCVIRALVVIRLPCFNRRRRVVQTLGIVQRRVLCEVVEVVRRGRREHGGRASVGAIGRRVVRVRQEAHTAVVADVGRIREILSHLFVRLRDLRFGTVFEVDLVEQAHRIRAVDARRHIAVFVHVRRVQAQRQQFGGDIDGDEIAGLAPIVRDDDLHRAQIGRLIDLICSDGAFERIDGLRAVRRRRRGDRFVLLAGEHDAVHLRHAHIVAELVGERHNAVAQALGRPTLGRGLDRRCRIARHLIPDRVEHGVERIGVGRRKIVVSVRRACAKGFRREACRVRVVARDALHERIRFERLITVSRNARDIGVWIGAFENTDRIDRSAVGLHRLRVANGVLRDGVIEIALRRRLPVSEEDDDL